MPAVLVPLAHGCEELEAITITDLLDRAEVTVVTAGLDTQPVKASHGAVLAPETTIDAVLDRDFDMVVLPGGMPGAANLRDDPRVIEFVARHHGAGKFVCAICAAPIALARAGVLKGRRATSYPGFLDKLDLPDVTCVSEPVVRDGNVVTAWGPGAAMDFALTLVELLQGMETRDKVEKGLMRP